ncbi:MAG TPA: S-layer homology domain-containing protein [Pseudobacteroides sp.]|uniref:S-layer homology domain-containing protein n=1 Tax=Pseudobacteroides sp. TaxID=1968840 RepID=UPI002F9413C9
MKRKTFKKSLAVILSLILTISVVVQNVSLVYGEEIVEPFEIITNAPGNFEKETFEIKNLYRVTSVRNIKDTNNETKITFNSIGNKVTIEVQGQNVDHISSGPNAGKYKYALEVKYTLNIAPKLEINNIDGKRYNADNSDPNKGGYIEINGTITDPNTDEKISLYYLVDEYSSNEAISTNSPSNNATPSISSTPTNTTSTSTPTISASGTPTVSSTPVPTPKPLNFQATKGSSQGKPFTITSNGSSVQFTCYIPIHSYSDGLHKINIWAEDEVHKKPENPMRVLTFINDKDNPKEPIIQGSPEKEYTQSVKVKISPPSPSSAIPENLTIFYCLKNENVCKKYTYGDEGFSVKENQTVIAACYDEFGKKSDIYEYQIKNIDTESPLKPSIKFTSETSVTDKITFIINHGIDKVKDLDTDKEINGPIKKSQYSYDEGKTWKDYNDTSSKEYAVILNTEKSGTFKIWAKTIDQAGNASEIYKSEDVTIKPPVAVTSPSPTGTQGTIITVPANVVPAALVSTSTPTPTNTPVQPTPTPSPIPVPADLGIFLTSAKTAYEENSTVAFSVYYTNKLDTPADKVVVKAQIPEKATVMDAAKGTVTGNTISWDLGTLKAKSTGEIIFKIKLGAADLSEVKMSAKASISSANQMKNADDDESTFNFIGFSKKIEGKPHMKFINGYETKEFKPENMVTRAEVAKILVTALSLGKGTDTGKKFKDVDKKHWAYDYIIAAVNNGLFSGYEDGTFLPNKAITRAELATALAKYLKLKNIEPVKYNFNDISKHWAKNYIEEIFRSKLIAGYSDGSFKPDAQIKRCECVTIIDRLLNRGPIKDADCGFIDVSKTHWAYGYIAEASIDHSYTRNTDGSETKKNK